MRGMTQYLSAREAVESELARYGHVDWVDTYLWELRKYWETRMIAAPILSKEVKEYITSLDQASFVRWLAELRRNWLAMRSIYEAVIEGRHLAPHPYRAVVGRAWHPPSRRESMTTLLVVFGAAFVLVTKLTR